MKKIILFLILSLNFAGQSALDYLDSLPEDIRMQFENQLPDEGQTNVLTIEDNLTSNNLENNLEDMDENQEEEPFFGYNFFETNAETNTPILDIPLQSDYILSFNDELELLLLGNVDKLFNIRIDLSGNVLIPEVGSISLVNLTINEANKKISTLIQDTYIGTKSYLSVSLPSLRKISIIGAVKNPGTYLVNPFISLSESIKYAGGLLENASIRNVVIKDLNGNEFSYDFYDFLIYGNRANDINILNGHTIIVPATSNFAEISGSVHREHFYEYKESDSFSDLISFALGLKKNANREKISANIQVNNVILTEDLELDERVSSRDLQSIHIGSKVDVKDLNVFVSGSGVVADGFYTIEKDENLKSFLDRLVFSDDIYPFFFKIETTNKNGLKKDILNLSILDIDSYADTSIGNNSVLTFYSRDEVLKEDTGIPAEFLKQIKFGTNSIAVPLTGSLTPRMILDYFSFHTSVNENEVVLAFSEGFIIGEVDQTVDSEDISILSFPINMPEEVSVEISGQVKNPGTYIVNSSTTLNQLYSIAGGLLNTASSKGIFFSRESIKQRQIVASENARNILYKSISNNSIESDQANQAELINLLDASANIEYTGRVSGDLSPNSALANRLSLETGDKIVVPYSLSTVTIVGEVLSPNTVAYEVDFDIYSYIEQAGGLTDNADKGSIYVIKANGLSEFADFGSFGRSYLPEPGDTIIVPRDIDRIPPIPLISVATKILADIAFSAASLRAISNWEQ